MFGEGILVEVLLTCVCDYDLACLQIEPFDSDSVNILVIIKKSNYTNKISDFQLFSRSTDGTETDHFDGDDEAFTQIGRLASVGKTNGRPSSIDRLGKMSYNPDGVFSDEEPTSETEINSEDEEISFNKPGDATKSFRDIVRQKILIPMWLSKNFDEKWSKLKDDLKSDEALKEKTRKVAADYGMMSKLPKEMASKLEPVALFGFASAKYRVGADQDKIFIDIRRQGGLKHAVKLHWNTRENTALQGKHFDYKSGVINFMPGKKSERIWVDLVQNDRVSAQNVQFMIEITKFEGLLWGLPLDSVEYGTNYSAFK